MINEPVGSFRGCASLLRLVGRGVGEMGEMMGQMWWINEVDIPPEHATNFELAWEVCSPRGHVVIEANELPDNASPEELLAAAYRAIEAQVHVVAGPKWDSLQAFVAWAMEAKGRANG